MIAIPFASELEESEKRKIWVRKDEHAAMKENARTIVVAIKRGLIDGTQCCTRGLERHMNVKEKRRIRAVAIGSVVDEQDEQDRLGIFDETRLMQVYRLHTWACTVEARKRGALDQEFAAAAAATAED